MIDRRILPFCGLLCVAFSVIIPTDCQAQREQVSMMGGLALSPGAGLHLGRLADGEFYTREVVLYADTAPSLTDAAEGDVHLAFEFGGSLRVLGIGRIIGNVTTSGYDLDVGMRFGPGLLFEFNENRFTKNQRFSLVFSPYIRGGRTTQQGRRLYAELGFQRPTLRIGLFFGR